MISNIVKIDEDSGKFVLFNKRGMVLELDASEYAAFKKHCDDTAFPSEDTDFWNKMCHYDMAEFEGYTPKDIEPEFDQALLTHSGEEPLYKAPIVAHLGITSACNMKCEYCSIRQPYHHTKELSTEEWKVIIRKLARLGAFQIGFTGGEPTLRKDLIELAEYVVKQGCTFNLTTNCWLLNEEIVKKLVKAGMKQCQLSLDSHIAEVNDKLRQTGSRDKVETAIKLLKKYDVAVGIDCVVSKNNIKTIPGFITWLSEKEVPFITLIKIKQGDLPLERFKELLPDYAEYSKLINDLCNRENKNPNVTIDCGSVSNLQHALREDELSKVPVAGCPVGHTLVSISPNGDIFPCVALSGLQFKVGNALTDDIEKLWKESPVFRQLRNLKSKITGNCTGCSRYNHCRGGCRGIAQSLHSLWESDKTCKFMEVKA